MRALACGIELSREVMPREGDTASAVGNSGIDVVATTALVLFIETVCHELVQGAYEEGEATVGVRVEVDHLGPARLGRPVRVQAGLERVEGRRLEFRVSVHQDAALVMRGAHHRVLVRASRFSRAPRPQRERRIDFWFDFHSPWCYLAASRIGDIARRHRARLHWRPVHLARLSQAIGGRRPLEENPAFVRWYRQDLEDQAALLGLPLRQHPDYPLRPSRALRAALHAQQAHGGNAAESLVKALMRAYWWEARDISDPAVLAELGRGAGLDAGALAAAASEGRFKRALEANLREAIEAGVFGVPIASLDGKLYFGNDRLDLLDRHLAGA